MTERHIRRAAVRTSNSAWYLTVAHADGETVLSGPDAARVLGQLLTYFNYRGGSSEDVDRAVELVSRCQSPHAGEPLMNHALAYEVRGGLRKLQRHEALALEIAVHEDAESRAAQGELAAMQPVVRDAIERAEIYETLT